MSERAAREILGVSPEASFKEIKKAHRGLVNIFHPDRAGRDPESQRKATESMSRINSAWAVIESRQANGRLGTTDVGETSYSNDSSWQFAFRRPGINECGICGCSPAEYLTIKGIAVMLIGIAWPGYQGSLCKPCAKAFSRETLRATMMRGWWGVWFFITPFVMLYQFAIMLKISKMKEPVYRDFRVITPYDMPVLARPNPLKEPVALLSMVAGVITVLTFSAIFGGNTGSEVARSTQQPTSLDCWTAPDANQQLINVSCSDSSAVYHTLASVLISTDCPAGTAAELDKNSAGYYQCLEYKK